MTTKLFIPFDDVRDLTLFACYVAVNEGYDLVKGESLSKRLDGLVSPNIISRHFFSLVKDGFLANVDLNNRRVQNKLIKYVEEKINERSSPFFELYRLGPEWLTSKYQGEWTGVGDEAAIPASDRIVRISDNDHQATAIVRDAQELRHQLQSSNDLGQLTTEEREIAIAEVEQIEAAFQPGSHRLVSMFALSDRTLRWIADKAAGAIVGATAVALLTAILAYLGLV